MVTKETFLSRFDHFVQFFSPILKRGDTWGEYKTDWRLERMAHRTVFMRAWNRSYEKLLEDDIIGSLDYITAPHHDNVSAYVTRMCGDLIRRHHASRPGSFEWDLTLGAAECVEVLYDEARAHTTPFIWQRMCAHAYLLKYSTTPAPSEYIRRYPHWFVDIVGFRCEYEEKRSSARSPAERMRATGPDGSVARTAVEVGDRPPTQQDGVKHIVNRYLLDRGMRDQVTLAPVVCSIGASFQTSRPHLGRFLEKQNLKGTMRLLRTCVSEFYRGLGATQLRIPELDDIWHARVNPDAFPGLLSKRRFKRKAMCYFQTGRIAERIMTRLQVEPLVTSLPWTVGGREKRQERELNEEVTSRLVQMPEDVITRLEAVLAEPLLERFKVVKKDIRVGMTYASGDYRIHFGRFDTCAHVKTFDWKSFDSSVGRELVLAAFAIMRSFYPESTLVDNLFGYLASSYFERNLVCPQGDIVRLRRGVPSGSGFTSLVGSIINWLILRSTTLCIDPSGAQKSVRIAVQGDDSVVGWPSYTVYIPSTEEFLDVAYELWGIRAGTPSPLAPVEGRYTCSDLTKCQSFLSVRSWLGEPTWSLRDFFVTELGYKKGIPTALGGAVALRSFIGFPAMAPALQAVIHDYAAWLYEAARADIDVRLFNNFELLIAPIEWETYKIFSPYFSGGYEPGVNHWGQKGRYYSEWDGNSRLLASVSRESDYELTDAPGAAHCYIKNLARTPGGIIANIMPEWGVPRGYMLIRGGMYLKPVGQRVHGRGLLTRSRSPSPPPKRSLGTPAVGGPVLSGRTRARLRGRPRS